MNEKTKGMSQTRLVFTHLRAAIVGGRLLPTPSSTSPRWPRSST